MTRMIETLDALNALLTAADRRLAAVQSDPAALAAAREELLAIDAAAAAVLAPLTAQIVAATPVSDVAPGEPE